MQTIATLGSNVRLLVIQFHMKKEFVPPIIPAYSDFHKAPSQVNGENGVRVMEPTPDVLLELFTNSDYQLVDAWTAPEDDGNRSEVRYVFCNPEQINPAGLRPDFLAQCDAILDSLRDLINKNLWQTMGHLNPFFIDGQQTDQKVMMFDCNSRKETVKSTVVSVDARFLALLNGDEYLPPIVTVEEPIMVLRDRANRLKLSGNEVVLVAPEPITDLTVSVV